MTCDTPTRTGRKRPGFRSYIKDERGLIASYLLSFAGIIFLVVFAVLLTLAFSLYTKGFATHQWLDEAMTYATRSAITRDEAGQHQVNERLAWKLFAECWQEMTDTTLTGRTFHPNPGSIYPAPMTVNQFRLVQPGEIISKGVQAEDLGFLIQMDVILWAGKVPFSEEQFSIAEVPLTVFSVRWDRPAEK